LIIFTGGQSDAVCSKSFVLGSSAVAHKVFTSPS